MTGLDGVAFTPPLAFTIPHFAEAVDLSKSTIYGAINSDALIPVYPAKRKPIITLEEGLRWLRSLPTEPRPA